MRLGRVLGGIADNAHGLAIDVLEKALCRLARDGLEPLRLRGRQMIVMDAAVEEGR